MFTKRNVLAWIGLTLFVVFANTPAQGQVKRVRMKIEGYLCGN